MSKFTKLKLKNGNRVTVDLTKVTHFSEVGAGTLLNLDNGDAVEVQEGYQTVGNRVKAAFGDAE